MASSSNSSNSPQQQTNEVEEPLLLEQQQLRAQRRIQRTVSFKLPTPFAEPTQQPTRAAGGILRNKHGKYRDLYDQRARTSVLVAIAGILERCNEQLLPSLYKYVGRSFDATPKQLGLITLSCALVQAISAPIGGMLGHYYNRVVVLSTGCFIWAICSAGFAITNTVLTGIAFWSFNGLGLGLLIPNAQSLIADYYKELSRGKAFGALYFTGALGGMAGSFFGTNLGHSHPFGIDGWRFAFLIVALVSALIGVINLLGSVDPRFKVEDPKYEQEPDIFKQHKTTPARMLSDIGSVLTVPSFVIVVIQGIVGSTPWQALVYNTLYCQLLGFTDFHASLIAALFLAGTAVGAGIGGLVGDAAAAKYPNHGRIVVAQFSVGIGVPLSALFYKGLPESPTTAAVVVLYCIVATVWGCLISWVAPAATSPIFGEVVPAQQRSIIYSFDRAFEGAVAAMGAPLVGWLAERLGFNTDHHSGSEEDLDSARALGTAMLLCTCIPWALCTIFFSGLHVTYPRDKKAAKVHQRARSGFATVSVLEELDEPLLDIAPSVSASLPRIMSPRDRVRSISGSRRDLLVTTRAVSRSL